MQGNWGDLIDPELTLGVEDADATGTSLRLDGIHDYVYGEDNDEYLD